MMNVCHRCGLYRADKIIDPKGPFAICPECGYKHPFLQLPLFLVSGASGTGKSTLYHRLLGHLMDFVLLDSDILWRAGFDQPENRYRDFMETWLRMCKNISQSGRPVMLFGAGTGVPENIEPCVERRYFSDVHYLALVCDEGELDRRLLDRPDWRGCNDAEFVERQKEFNRWFKAYGATHGEFKISLLDTTSEPAEVTAKKVASWSSGLYYR